jgi:Zn-finger protein
MKMKTSTIAVAVALALPGVAMAAPGTGIAGTDHDFAAKYLTTQTDGAGNWLATAQSVGLCSYCHTPHSAQSTALLWNHKLSSNSFTWDDATTAGGTPYPTLGGSTYKGPTVKCLSCHDGSVAIGDVSLYRESKGSVFNTYQVGTPVAANGGVNTAPNIIKKIGAGGQMGGNHPVGMPYPFNQTASSYNGQTTGNRVEKTEFVANPVNQNGTFIKLYNDDGTGRITNGANGAATGIECSSCHDPHNKQTVDTLLLRANIAGSAAAGGGVGVTTGGGYICLQCHIK